MDDPDVTTMLHAWAGGDVGARERLVPLVYQDLRRRAAAYLRRERRDHTLQPTALVHEAYLRLINQDRAAWQNRAQFFGVASQIMRRILVDHARRANGEAIRSMGEGNARRADRRNAIAWCGRSRSGRCPYAARGVRFAEEPYR